MSGARPEHALHHIFAEVLEVGVGELVASRSPGLQPLRDPPGRELPASEASAGAAAAAKTAATSAKMSETRTVMAATLRPAGSARIRRRHVRGRGAIRERPTGGVEALELWREGLGRMRLPRAGAQHRVLAGRVSGLAACLIAPWTRTVSWRARDASCGRRGRDASEISHDSRPERGLRKPSTNLKKSETKRRSRRPFGRIVHPSQETDNAETRPQQAVRGLVTRTETTTISARVRQSSRIRCSSD